MTAKEKATTFVDRLDDVYNSLLSDIREQAHYIVSREFCEDPTLLEELYRVSSNSTDSDRKQNLIDHFERG